MYTCTGFPPTLEIMGNLENEFQFSSQGKLGEFEGGGGNQGKLGKFVTVTQKRKVFTSLVYVRLVPCVSSCVH